MDEMTPDPNLKAYAALAAEMQALDKRMEALENVEALDCEAVERYVVSLPSDRPVIVADLLSAEQLLSINEAYDALLNQGVQCSREDYALAATCGVFGGIVDVLFASDPGNRKSPLEKFASNTTDNLVLEYARRFPPGKGWNPRPGNEHNIASAIGHLERAYKVNYDQETSERIGGAVRHLTAKNHHVKSLAHYPDLLGLVASIVNQFTDTSTFVGETGRIVIVRGADNGFELKGKTFVQNSPVALQIGSGIACPILPAVRVVAEMAISGWGCLFR